jgi:acetyl-CoA carboxylase biotin carboxyl carrier protein
MPSAPAERKYHEIKSPIVGTFYRAPSPDASAFVDVGSKITPGTVLCIVEAMKLMNEIESDISGTIVKIVVESGKAVEYNQVLFLVEKA